MFNLSLKRLKNGVSKERKTKIRSLKSEQLAAPRRRLPSAC